MNQTLKLNHHKLIYGAPVKIDTDVNVIAPFEKYYLPPRDGSEYYFIGFQYGQINNLYEKLNLSYDALQYTKSKPSPEIVDLFGQHYPTLKTNTYALFQDVYTSLFCRGFVTYGYWITKFNKDILSDKAGNCVCGDAIFIFCPGHNMRSTIDSIHDIGIMCGITDNAHMPSHYFVGKFLDEFQASSATSPENLHMLAEKLSTTYVPAEKMATKSEILTELHKIDPSIELSVLPVITMLQIGCYCCDI